MIPQGASLGEIADLLEAEGVVDSSSFFQLRARINGRSGDLKPGPYTLAGDMAYADVLDTLEEGVPPNVVMVTIPEGRSRGEIAPTVRRLEGNYRRATRRSPLLDPRDYGAPGPRTLEGFLFPATYELKKGQPVRKLVDQQLSTFKQNFAKVDMSYAKRKNLTRYDVLIIASLVEREAPGGEGAADHRLGDLQPAQERHPARHRRHHALRRRQLDRAAQAVRAGQPVALQHAGAPEPAARADRQPRPGLDQGGGAPGQDRLPVLRGQAQDLRPPQLRRDRRRVPALRGRVRAARARRPGASRPTPVDRALRRPRLPGGAQPLAGDDERGLRRARARLALPAPAGGAGAVRADRARRCPARATAAPT